MYKSSFAVLYYCFAIDQNDDQLEKWSSMILSSFYYFLSVSLLLSNEGILDVIVVHPPHGHSAHCAASTTQR